MIVQRPECAASTKILTGLYKISQKDFVGKMQPQQHIKRIISTAATATGIVGDVDALPAPVQNSHKSERNLWRLEEIKEVLNIMQQINALELLNDKTVKSEKVFRNIEQMMHRKGFRKKSHAQIWTKWKFLKSTYMTSRRNRIVPKMIPYEIYQVLHKMLSSSFGMSTGNSSTASLDGDNSNCEDNSFNCSNISNVKAEQSELAHPIFGFRLGLVKSEPLDTGYETTANNSAISEADSLDESAAYAPTFSPNNSNGNMTQHSFIDIKEERVTDSPTPPSPSLLSQDTPEEESLLVPRGTESLSITPILDNAAPAVVHMPTAISMPSLPPLRIAPFANERNMKEALKRMDHSPPPLSMNPIMMADTQNTTEEDGTTFIRKMLRNSETATVTAPALPPNTIVTRPSVLRLPKEVTLQLRGSDSDANAVRAKQAPIRQTSYSLRAERTIPNLNDTLPPLVHQNQKSSLPSNKNFTTYHTTEQPMTSQMASQINAKIRATSQSQSKNKKRRLDIPTWDDVIHPTKITRSGSSVMSHNQRQKNECPDDSFNESQNSTNNEKMSPNFERLSPEEFGDGADSLRKERALMEEMLKDLAMSLRQTQLEMIENFFENQMEITRKEHEYQMKQDQLIMEAFQEQTRQLMNSANQIFGLHQKRTQSSSNSGSDARKNVTSQQVLLKTKNKSYDANANTQEVANTTSSENARANKTWLNESNYNTNECLENECENDNMESAVDPIQFVTSELVEEYDNA